MKQEDSFKLTTSKKEWPVRLGKLFMASILLGFGVFLGVFLTLHASGVVSVDSNGLLNRVPWYGLSKNELLEGGAQKWLSFGEWLAGPSLRHNLSDPELLWVASTTPRRAENPLNLPEPKVAFMFLTRGPLPLAPLWERFFTQNREEKELYTIYVHAAPGFKLDLPPSSVFYGRQIPSQEAKWGDISMCDAERRLLANALLDRSNERFVLLSETCIPLRPLSEVRAYLVGSKHSFVGAFDDPGPYGRGRYNTHMSPLVALEQWRKGSQWFELDRRLATFIVADTSYYNAFRDFCRPACYVDEHYLPTMLHIEYPSAMANRSITWVDWSRGGPHPGMFGGGDITESFLSGLQLNKKCTYNGHESTVCFLFARKFAPNALEPLLKLSHKILGF